MKRCPECRRDYYDDSLLYCLEDGTALVQGSVPSPDEPQTAILREVSEPNRPATELLDRAPTTGPISVSTTGRSRVWIVGGAVVLLVIAIGAYIADKNPGRGSGEIKSIAVLPFENKSSDPDTDYLSDGLGESLIFRLSQLPGLKVSPLSSVSRYKDPQQDITKVAKELGVDSVMTGKMVKRGDDLSITVELVDVRNNASIWGERYERKMSDLLALQRDIATTITQKLQLKLAGNEKGITKKYTDSNEAYQLYLNARFHFQRRSKDEIYKSIDLFQQAVAVDPNFALAYAGLAEAWAVIPSYPYASPAECFPKAKAAVARALELDPDLPEAHTVAGMIAATYDWDWATAEREFKRSLDLDPNLAATHYRYAWTYLSPLGRHDAAVAEMRKAMELEPLSIPQGANFAGVLLYARRFEEALEQARKTYDLDPTHVVSRSWISNCLNINGLWAETIDLRTNKIGLSGPAGDASLAYAYAKTGQREKALEIANQMKSDEKERYVMNYWLAVVFGALGDKDAALRELDKAFESHDWFLQRIKVDPFMDELRDDPRFESLVKKLNFPQ